MSPRDRIPLTSITALTLRSDSRTTFRRTSAVPQLTCRGKGCRQFQPSVVQCVPVGSSGSGVEWKCEADLPSNLSFGSIEVSCEGYDSPDDPYVLRGQSDLSSLLVARMLTPFVQARADSRTTSFPPHPPTTTPTPSHHPRMVSVRQIHENIICNRNLFPHFCSHRFAIIVRPRRLRRLHDLSSILRSSSSRSSTTDTSLAILFGLGWRTRRGRRRRWRTRIRWR